MSQTRYIQPPHIPDGPNRRIFKDIYDRLNGVYRHYNEKLSGPSTNYVKHMNDMVIAGLDTQGVVKLVEPLPANTEINRLYLENDSVQFRANQKVRVVNIYSLEYQTFTVQSDISETTFTPTGGVEGLYPYVDINPATTRQYYPAGSYVFYDPNTILLGMLAGTSVFQIFAESNAIGQLTAPASVGDNSLNVNLWGFVSGGDVLDLLIETVDDSLSDFYFETKRVNVSKYQEKYTGLITLPLTHNISFNAPEGAYIKINGVSFASKFHMDPGKIQLSVNRSRTASSIGDLNSTITSGDLINTISLKNVYSTVKLKDNQVLTLYNQRGESQEVSVNGDQDVTPTTHIVNVDSFTADFTFIGSTDPDVAVSWLEEPSYRQSGRITVQADSIEAAVFDIGLNSTSISSLTLDVSQNDTAIASLETSVNSVQDDLNDAEGDISVLNSSVLTLQSDLNSAEASLGVTQDQVDDVIGFGGVVIRQNSAPSQRKSGYPLKVGDYWIESDNNDKLRYWDGNSWEDTDAGLKSNVASIDLRVDDLESEITLKVTQNDAEDIADAQITLRALDDLGSLITLDADNILFGSTSSTRININNNTYMGRDLNSLKDNNNRVLIGEATNGIPFVHVRQDSDNFVEMVARSSGGSSNPYFQVVANGNTVFKVWDNGFTQRNSNDDWNIDLDEGITFKIAGSSYLNPRGLNWQDSGNDKMRVFCSQTAAIIQGLGGHNVYISAETGGTITLSTPESINLSASKDISISAVGNAKLVGLPTSNPSVINSIYKISNFQGSGHTVLCIS